MTDLIDCFGRSIRRTVATNGMYEYTVTQAGKVVLTLSRPKDVLISDVVRTIEGMKTGDDPLEVRRETLCKRVNAVREEKVNAPLLFGGTLFDADPESLTRINGVLTMLHAGLVLPSGFTWRSFENKDIPMNSTKLHQLAGAIFERQYTCFAKSWALKAEIQGSDAPESLDIESGWP
jgi:hypothetical protein